MIYPTSSVPQRDSNLPRNNLTINHWSGAINQLSRGALSTHWPYLIRYWNKIKKLHASDWTRCTITKNLDLTIITPADVLRTQVISDMELLVWEFIVYWIEHSFVTCLAGCLLKYTNYWWKTMIMGFKCVLTYILLPTLITLTDIFVAKYAEKIFVIEVGQFF